MRLSPGWKTPHLRTSVVDDQSIFAWIALLTLSAVSRSMASGKSSASTRLGGRRPAWCTADTKAKDRGDGEMPLLSAFNGAILAPNCRNLANVRSEI